MNQDKDLVSGWIVDIHSSTSDGDGIRFAMDPECDGSCAVSRLWMEESEPSGNPPVTVRVVKHEYLCQWYDMVGLAEELEEIARLLRQSAKRREESE